VIQPRTVDNIRCDSVIFNVDNMRKALSSLKPCTSSGPDGVPNVLLNKLAYSVYNLSAISLIPVSNLIVFLHYRPMSLTRTCCRVMERVIDAQLIDYLLSNNLTARHPHGFLLKHSTCTHLLETINDWVLALDNRLKTEARPIYIDFQNTFDSACISSQTSCQISLTILKVIS